MKRYYDSDIEIQTVFLEFAYEFMKLQSFVHS